MEKYKKKINECSAEEILNSFEVNKDNFFFPKIYKVLNETYKIMIEKNIAPGKEMLLLNQSFEQLKKSLDPSFLFAYIMVLKNV